MSVFIYNIYMLADSIYGSSWYLNWLYIHTSALNQHKT